MTVHPRPITLVCVLLCMAIPAPLALGHRLPDASSRLSPPASRLVTTDDPPKEEPQKPAPTPPPVPSLDELLGTKPETSPNPTTPDELPPELTDPSRADLDRLLKGQEIGEAFTEAVRLMSDAADRMEAGKDTGLTTQRVQEDIIRRLDQLLASMQRQQSSSSSSSSSSSQQQQDKQSQRNQPNQQRGQKKPGQDQQTNNGQGQRTDEGPPRQDGDLRPALDSARAAWGSLPERIREMLLQGSSDRFSAKYQALTEAYYKRLAEEKK